MFTVQMFTQQPENVNEHSRRGSVILQLLEYCIMSYLYHSGLRELDKHRLSILPQAVHHVRQTG
jgi:hypothetical protein